MASTTGWNSSTNAGVPGNDQSLNNSSGFNAFPEGNRYNDGSFDGEGRNAVFWSSTEYDTLGAYSPHLNTNTPLLSRLDYGGKQHALSVRFVRD